MIKYTNFIFLALLISLFLVISCTKEVDCIDGTVRFTNASDYPYELYIDGEFKMKISGNSFTEMELSEGKHKGRVRQYSGYLFFPTEVNSELNVFGCEESQWIFP